MIVKIDEREIYIDDRTISTYLQNKIMDTLGKEIQLPNGPKIDLTRTSLMSVAIRQVVTFLVPLLTWAAAQSGEPLPKKEKHSDVILYCVNGYFQIINKLARDATLNIQCKPYLGDLETIDKVTFERDTDDIGFLMDPSS